MSEEKIFAKEYEEFLITGKEDVVNSLPNGSLEKEYFLIIRQLLKEEYSQDLNKKINLFLKNYSLNIDKLARLKALLIYKKMQKNPNKKEEIIKDIKDLFNLGNVKTYSKPIKYNKMAKDENEIEENKIPNKFNLEEHFKVYQLIDDIYMGKIIPNSQNVEKILGNSYLDYKFDFNKIPVNSLVEMIQNEYYESLKYNQNNRWMQNTNHQR